MNGTPRPVPCFNIGADPAASSQIHRKYAKLGISSPLQKEHLVVLWHAEQVTKTGFRFVQYRACFIACERELENRQSTLTPGFHEMAWTRSGLCSSAVARYR